jgi:hypothetical protein
MFNEDTKDYWPRGQMFRWGGGGLYILTVIPQDPGYLEEENMPTHSPWIAALIDIKSGNRLTEPSIKMVRNNASGHYENLDECCLWVRKNDRLFQREQLDPVDEEVKNQILKAVKLIHEL